MFERLFRKSTMQMLAPSDAREKWLSLFDTAIHGLVEYEMKPRDAIAVVDTAAAIADAALDAYERRWQ